LLLRKNQRQKQKKTDRAARSEIGASKINPGGSSHEQIHEKLRSGKTWAGLGLHCRTEQENAKRAT
jgi:hypothetical protein